MSITIPSAPHVVTADQLIFRALGEDPLGQMLENTNYLYATHSPALLNACPLNDETASFECVFPLPASIDGLSYTVVVHTWNSTSASMTSRLYSKATSSSGSWGTLNAGDVTTRTGHKWWSMSGTVPTGMEFGRVTVTVASGTVQVHSITIYPGTVGSLSAGAYASGFVAYDDNALAASGGAIHTEHFNRIAANTRAVLRDRKQAVFAYLDKSVGTRALASSVAAVHTLGYSGAHLPGQAGATVTVRARAAHTTGSGSTLNLGELGGNSVSLACDDTDVTAVLELRSDQPMFQATLSLSGTATVEVYYLTVDWTPGD